MQVSWIYNLLGSALHGLIKKDVESAIQKAVLEFTNDKLPAMVDAAPTVVKVGGGKSTVDLGVQVRCGCSLASVVCSAEI